jgi:SnoaL-like protein
MTHPDAQSVARAYHSAWVGKRFDEAVALLSPKLVVEVPINDYPTKESFASALMSFGRLVSHADLLSEMAAGDEAMQLYDMEVEGLGTIRVVEHFTVVDGEITRLRQIHDTAALRALAP